MFPSKWLSLSTQAFIFEDWLVQDLFRISYKQVREPPDVIWLLLLLLLLFRIFPLAFVIILAKSFDLFFRVLPLSRLCYNV